MTAGGHPTKTTPLHITPLGGLGEFGMNMMAIQYGDAIIVVDTGLMFPDETHHGVDFIVPDMTALLEGPTRVEGVFLSHGHDDHIGALPHLYQKVRAPVYGTRLTLGLPRAARVRFTVFDLQGRAVWAAPARSVAAGRWDLSWPGRTAAGESVRPGIYLATVDVDGTTFVRRIAVTR